MPANVAYARSVLGRDVIDLEELRDGRAPGQRQDARQQLAPRGAGGGDGVVVEAPGVGDLADRGVEVLDQRRAVTAVDPRGPRGRPFDDRAPGAGQGALGELPGLAVGDP